MSNNNDQSGASGFAFMAACILTGLMYLAVFIYILLCLFSLFMTIMALIALVRPVAFAGMLLDRRDGLEVLGFGLLGMILVPVGAELASQLLEFDISSNAEFYIILGGYAFGSTFLAALLEDEDRVRDGFHKSPTVIDHQPQPPLPAPPRKPQFASWDDEELRR